MEEEYVKINEITAELLEYWSQGLVSGQSVSQILHDSTDEPTGEVEILWHSA